MRVTALVLLASSAAALNIPETYLKAAAAKDNMYGGHHDIPMLRQSTKFDYEKVRKLRAENVQKATATSIIFYGDSLVEQFSGQTMGSKDENPNSWLGQHKIVWEQEVTKSYGRSLASGINGDRVDNLLYRLQHGESPAKAQPRVIMLEIGSNDVKGEENEKNSTKAAQSIFAGYKKVVEELDHSSPHSSLVLLSVLPRGKGTTRLLSHINELNKLIKGLDDEKTIYFVDCGRVFLKDGLVNTNLMPDGVHPSPQGAKAWTKCFKPTLDKILKKSNTLLSKI